MIRSAVDIPRNSLIEGDLCIVGAGAAGISIAREFANSSKRIVLLESGGLGFDLATQDLYGGQSEGTPPARRKNYLLGSRLRFLGGSTNHWEGYCRPLDAIDFQPRSTGIHHGWPFPRSTLAPWFSRAAELLQIKNFRELSDGPSPSNLEITSADSPFDVRFFYFSPPTRFGSAYRSQLEQASAIDLITMANARSVALDSNGRSVSHIDVATLTGNQFRVRANQYVLALGGIENARLLLLSNDIQKNGVGNEHDLVGRYFMEHPQFPAGHMVTRGLMASIQGLKRRKSPALSHDVRGVLIGKAALLEREGLNNFSIQVDEVVSKPESWPEPVARTHQYVQKHFDTDSLELSRLYVRMEQAPHRDSRITLSTERDALGQQRSHLQWKLSDHEYRTGEAVLKLLARDLGARNLGRVVTAEGDAPWLRLEVSSHHLGTTRMGSNPKESVVDTDCRVHGVENLSIAGSSVFPSGGYANPTFTIVTLALRLSDRLKAVL